MYYIQTMFSVVMMLTVIHMNLAKTLLAHGPPIEDDEVADRANHHYDKRSPQALQPDVAEPEDLDDDENDVESGMQLQHYTDVFGNPKVRITFVDEKISDFQQFQRYSEKCCENLRSARFTCELGDGDLYPGTLIIRVLIRRCLVTSVAYGFNFRLGYDDDDAMIPRVEVWKNEAFNKVIQSYLKYNVDVSIYGLQKPGRNHTEDFKYVRGCGLEN